MSSTSAKEPTKLKITSDKEQYEGGELSIQLTNLNKTPISEEIVNVTITNSKGKVVVDDVVKTNSKGKAKLDLDLKKGKYTVNVTYDGNENYTGNNTTQKLTIKKEVVKVQETSSADNNDYSESSSSQNTLSYDSDYNIYYDDNGVVVDLSGENYMGDAGKTYQEVREKYEWIDEHGLY